ncbi:MAG TPA: outer membrane protein transport protein [Gammaproteobacteria bacterium]|nr:outer membrane protein transport protein [Gammaproteobacteria bacterium]
MKSRHLAQLSFPLLAAAIATALPLAASASNFQLSEQSVTSLGRAHAGGAAAAEDASSIWYNPAGLTRLDDSEFLTGASLIRLGADFTKTSATDASGQALSGGEGGNVGKLGAVPFIYYSTPINDKLDFGIGLGVPFGLATSYDADSIFRYQAIYTSVTILNLDPTLAYRFTDHFSGGFGLDIQRMSVKLTNDVDYGAVCFGKVNPSTCTAMNLTPQGHDGFFQGEAKDSSAFGFNLGLLWDYDTYRIGFSYRSKIKHSLDGSATFTNVPSLFWNQGLFHNQSISADFTTPQMASLSGMYKLNDQWSLYADWSYTGWSSFDRLTINFANSAQPPSTVDEGLSNVNRLSFGTDYRYSDSWTFRAGVAWDKSPVPDPTSASNTTANDTNASRGARLPDADRKWLAFGATWRVSEHSQWDIGYSHLFLNGHIPFNQLNAGGGDHVVGQFDADADILGVSYRYRF